MVSLPNLLLENVIKILNDKPLFLVLAYVIIFMMVYSLMSAFSIVEYFPSTENLINWDAVWYQKIATKGYVYYTDKQSSVAFFPAFPLFWRTLGESPWAAVFGNVLVYVLSASLLFKHLKVTLQLKLLVLAGGPMIFFFLPFSESVFFLFGTLLLIGLKEKKLMFLFLGILGAGITRSAVVVALPSFLFMSIMIWNKEDKSTNLKRTSIIALALILSVFVSVFVQWLDTGEWFVFIEVQKHWGHGFGFPEFPFWSLGRHSINTDVAALVIGAICGVEVLILFLNKLNILKNRELNTIEATEYFSLGYCLAIALYVFLFQGGDLHSLNRYIFATAYYWFFVFYVVKNQKTMLPILIGCIVIFQIAAGMFLNVGIYRTGVGYFRMLFFQFSIFAPLFLYSKPHKWSKVILWICTAILFVNQIHYLHMYLKGEWIG